MSEILVHTINNEHSRQLVEGFGRFLGQTYSALYRYPVTALYPPVEDVVFKSMILGNFFRQRSVEVNAIRRIWHYDGDRAFQEKSGDQPEPCKWHIFPCMFRYNLESHDRLNKVYMNKEILYNH